MSAAEQRTALYLADKPASSGLADKAIGEAWRLAEMLLKPFLFGFFEELAPICVECFKGVLELPVLHNHLP